MKRFIPFILLLFAGMDAYAQGSAPSPPHLWKRKGTADTSYVVIKTGDTVMVYDTAGYTKLDLRGANTSWLIPDSVNTVYLATSTIRSGVVAEFAGSGFIMNTFAQGPDTIWSLIGNGLEIQGGYLTVTIGASVEGSEITNQTITKSDIDTTSVLVAAQFAVGSSASTDNYAKPKHYIDSFLFGYPRVGTPSGSQTPIFDAGLNSWTFGAGGGGSGDNARIDMTLGSEDYVLGGTTYPGGFFDVSTYTMRGDTGIDLVKSGQDPGDTIIHRLDWNRVQRNDGTRDIRVFRTDDGTVLLRMYDNGIYTRCTTSNAGGWELIQPLHLANNLVFDTAVSFITGLYSIMGRSGDGYGFSISDDSSVLIQNGYTNRPTYFGSSTNWTLWSDTLRGVAGQSKIFDISRITVDTVRTGVARMVANSFKFVTDTTNPTQDVAATMTRDTANDTTKFVVAGKLQMTADAGMIQLQDSGRIEGKWLLESSGGTNATLDSGLRVQADSVAAKTGFKAYGSTSGSIVIKAPATAGTQIYTLPADDGDANEVLGTNGSGTLDWVSGGAGGGNGSADFDSTTGGGLDSNILKGAGGTVLLDIHKSATPNVVIGKGPTMTSLIIGGNNSALASVDTSLLIYNSLDFGNGFDDKARLDSGRVWNAIRLNRQYYNYGDIYWHASRALTFGITGTWGYPDSAGVTDTVINTHLFTLVDSAGSTESYYPIHFRTSVGERDSLFSFVFSYKTGSGTDTSTNGITKAVLAVNGARVDSVTGRNLFSSTLAVDSMNFTDRALAIGDMVTILLYCRTNPAAARRTITIDDAYLNMRRY